MKFQEREIYVFDYDQVKYMGGKMYFMLTYGENKAKSLPGYENNWQFRVEMLDYQKAWTQDEIPDVFSCYVAGFIRDLDDQKTEFPILKQDLHSILKTKFSVGKCYQFSVTDCYTEDGYYLVSDLYGITQHKLYTQAEYKVGDSVELTVDRIDNAWLGFVDPLLEKMRENFKIGKKYEFDIQTEEVSKKGDYHFYVLRDKTQGKYLHRFYFNEDRKDGPGDEIELEVKNFSERGWLILADPNNATSSDLKITDEQISELIQIEDHASGREDEHREFKSSFVFTARGDRDIDRQLGEEIMQQLAAFMNADGGTVFLGYRNDGSICGINKDIQYLNSSSIDEYTYAKSLDGVEVKIHNTIKRSLGDYANTLVSVEFRKTENKLLVCHLTAKASTKPIYLNQTALYKRSGNMCQLLLGDGITFFVFDHFTKRIMQSSQNISPAAPQPKTADHTTVVEESAVKAILPTIHSSIASVKPWQCITLYKDGTVSRQKQEIRDEDVLFNIPLTTDDKNKSSRLVFCYDNGCINILNPKDVVELKLSKESKKYLNGYNKEATMMYPILCDKDDFLVIRSRQKDGVERIKTVALNNYKLHRTMHTNGNMFVDPLKAKVESVEVIPAEQSSFVYPVLVKSKNGMPGYEASQYPNVTAFLKQRKQQQEG